jgi:hypothetical protein
MSAPPSKNKLLGAAILLALVVIGAFLFTRPKSTRPPRPSDDSARTLPTDPLAWVPVSAQAVVIARVERLRASPPLAHTLADVTPADGCEADLARRLRTVTVVVPRFPLADFALVAMGDFDEATLSRCATSRAGAVIERENYRDVRVTRIKSARDGAAQPPSAEILWLPGGVVLAGEHDLVRALLDRGIDGRDGRAERSQLGAMLASSNRDAALTIARWFPSGDPSTGGAWGTVRSLTADVYAEKELDLRARLRCDGDEGAAGVFADLERSRADLLRDTPEGGVRVLIERARVTRDGPELQVSAVLDEAAFNSLLSGVSSAARGLGSYLQPAPRDR